MHGHLKYRTEHQHLYLEKAEQTIFTRKKEIALSFDDAPARHNKSKHPRNASKIQISSGVLSHWYGVKSQTFRTVDSYALFYVIMSRTQCTWKTTQYAAKDFVRYLQTCTRQPVNIGRASFLLFLAFLTPCGLCKYESIHYSRVHVKESVDWNTHTKTSTVEALIPS